MSYTPEELQKIPHVLSEPRFATYLRAKNNDRQLALKLYQWNLEVSAAFIAPLHVLEVVLRNATIDAIESVHGLNWAFNNGFIRSLPEPSNGYKPRSDLINTSRRQPTTGKVVADLKFIFWEKMFTVRHDSRLWDNHLRRVLPFAPSTLSVQSIRSQVNSDIRDIRQLRNRIAHHEPIFTRQLSDDYTKILKLIEWRDDTASLWLDSIQNVTSLLPEKP
jgi:hypothetical protein